MTGDNDMRRIPTHSVGGRSRRHAAAEIARNATRRQPVRPLQPTGDDAIEHKNHLIVPRPNQQGCSSVLEQVGQATGGDDRGCSSIFVFIPTDFRCGATF